MLYPNNNNTQLLFILFFCVALLFSCSKEEEEVTLAEPNTPVYDLGHITIKMNEVFLGFDPAISVASITLTNQTKGTVDQISPSLFVYLQQDGYSVLQTTFVNGNINDQLECCVNFTSAINVGIGMRFETISPDSIPTPTISYNYYCANGTYQ